MHAHVVVHLGEYLEAVAHDAAQAHVLVVGHLVHGVLACLRVQLVDAVEQVVADVDEAVGVYQEIVHLRETVADGPLGQLIVRQVGVPGSRFGHLLRVLAQVAVLLAQQARHLLVVIGRQAGTVGVHALDDTDPLLLGALAAHEGRGLLVTEGAIELEGFLQCLVTAKIQLRQPHVGRVAGNLLLGGHGLQDNLALGCIHIGVDVALGAQAVAHRFAGVGKADLAGGIGETGEHGGAGIGDPVGRVTVIAEVGLGLLHKGPGDHDRGQWLALGIFHCQGARLGKGCQQRQGYCGCVHSHGGHSGEKSAYYAGRRLYRHGRSCGHIAVIIRTYSVSSSGPVVRHRVRRLCSRGAPTGTRYRCRHWVSGSTCSWQRRVWCVCRRHPR